MRAFAGAARTTQCSHRSASVRPGETLQQPFLAQARVAARAQCGLSRPALRRWNHLAGDREADAPGDGLGHRHVALVAEHCDGARRVGRRRDPHVDLHAHGVELQRVVLRDAGRELLVRDQDPLLAAGAEDRVVEADVLDDPVLTLDRHPVADSDRLRDGEHHAGDHVGERLAGREADDRGGHDARGEQAGGDLVDAIELRATPN